MPLTDDFDQPIGILEIPTPKTLDLGTIGDDDECIDIRNASQPLEDKTSIAFEGFLRETKISDQAFLYAMHDFATRNSQKIIVALDNGVVMSCGDAIRDKLNTEFKQKQFFCMPRTGKDLKKHFKGWKEANQKQERTVSTKPEPEDLLYS